MLHGDDQRTPDGERTPGSVRRRSSGGGFARLARRCQQADDPDSDVSADEAAEAWGSLYSHFRPRIASFCRRALPGNDGEDLASDIMMKARFRIGSFDARRPFAPWLFRIASNRCWDEARRARRAEPLDESRTSRLEAESSSPLDLLITRESRDQVRGALARLPRRQRFALSLRYGADLSYREIAEALGIPAGQVGVMLLRGRRRLRALLEGAGGNAG